MAQSNKKFLEDVFSALRETDAQGLNSNKGQDILGGLSGLKTVGALQRLAGLFKSYDDACYLEVGVFQGLSLLSVALDQPNVSCFGIDDFSILDPEQKNLALVKERMEKLNVENAILINEGFEEAFDHLDDYLQGRKIGVYFYDGAHDYRSQIMGLAFVQAYLHENCVLIVDDANYEFVRQSSVDFLKSFPSYKLAFEAYSPAHPANMDKATLQKHEAGWLNGINILVSDPDNLLPVMLPAVNPDKSLYVNDWLVHRHPLAHQAAEALDRLCDNSLSDGLGKSSGIENKSDAGGKTGTLFYNRNTFSEGLPESRFNAFKN